MTNPKTCATCKWWIGTRYEGSIDKYETAQCRQHAPIASEKFGQVWPLTCSVDWCGDHEELNNEPS